MTTRIFTDRSRIIAAQRCPRFRFLQYHQDGTGIVPARTPLPLAVGGSVHVGLALLLYATQTALYRHEEMLRSNTGMVSDFWVDQTCWKIRDLIESDAVAAALEDFSRHQSKLTLDAGEVAAMAPTPAAEAFQSQVIEQARELGMDPAQIGQLGSDPAVAQSEFDRYIFAEQSALVEGLVRAYARRRLRPLLEQFEVLEVEREGEWKLSEWERPPQIHEDLSYDPPDTYELWFMSRPDALLRERTTNELYLLSYKTTAAWDVRKARDIEHDMQGLSEGVEVERRLGEWCRFIWKTNGNVPEGCSEVMYKYLCSFAPNTGTPRIHAIRYEHLLKGERWKDKELSARLGIEVRSQKSPLVRQYVAVSVPKKGDGGYRVGDVCVAWDYYRVEDDRDGSLSWQNWKSRPVWDAEITTWQPESGVKDWIDKLDRSELLMSGEDSTMGLQPRALGWKSDAQAMGVTKEHPLDAVFVPPVTVWRNDDQLRDWIESTEHKERETAQHVAEVHAATDPGERRHLLNIYFEKHLHSCEYPSQCPYAHPRTGVCFAGAEMQADPLAVGGGEYVRRVPNHPQELVQIK